MIAVIYYAYGAPKSIDDVQAYFSHILKGKPVPAQMFSGIEEAFKQSGFPDFIRSSTERIAKALQTTLNSKSNEEIRVYNAYKHTAPFVEDVYNEAVQAGAKTIVTLSVNPILSVGGGGAVHAEVAELASGSDIRHIAIDNWHLDEGIISVYAERVRRAFEWLPAEAQKSAYILFTAYSQPIVPERSEFYAKQFEDLAAAIAKKANIERFQPVYRSGKSEGWLAPNVKDAMRSLQAEGAQGFVTCELLSVSADVESFSEINEQCQKLAAELNVSFATSEFLGDSFDTIIALTALVEKHI
ncbi:ferrochelatase [Metasolibacillus sp.]|uniref:ferrochelatase n=1 Tax=Metasolibacillus sp. TaxID=2703680 RepID=UPI0025F92E9A|nr:ferrochelatase [Metasolibacillus sp.]MCT6924406.1 ferrochelatase [Metasolibacillus sp.]MCT6940507.1 ferrochelatase [Metasolibacillus sp.]